MMSAKAIVGRSIIEEKLIPRLINQISSFLLYISIAYEEIT
jgi:hypothetical protein